MAGSPKHYRKGPIGDRLLVLRPQHAGDARSQIGEAVEHQPHAEDARKKPRSVHQQAERKQPESPKDLVRKYPLAMRAEEYHDENLVAIIQLEQVRVGEFQKCEKERSCILVVAIARLHALCELPIFWAYHGLLFH